MEIAGLRLLVVGATGVIGGALAALAAERGARLAVAGRDPARLAAVAAAVGAEPGQRFDAYDVERCAALAARAADGLGGLDAVVTAFGSAAFGRAEEGSDAVDEHLLTVNALAPVAVLRGALPVLAPGGALAAVTGAVVDRPTAGMAGYGASKAALAAWLDAVRLEQHRNRITVLDARLPHLDTGFAGRAVAGRAPGLPAGADLPAYLAALLDGLCGGAARLAAGGPDGGPLLSR